MTADNLKLLEYISKQHPEFQIRSFEIIGEGLDNIAAEVNGHIIIRFAKNRMGSKAIRQEVQLLGLLAGVRSVEIPVPIAELNGINYFAYEKIQGLPLILGLDRTSDKDLSSICKTLGRFLSELHSVSSEELKGLVPIEAEPFRELLQEASASFDLVKDIVPEALHAGVREFLDGALPKQPADSAFIHNDLGIEHLIVNSDNGIRLGIIDWSDAAIGDPALDFCRIYRDLGSKRLNQVFRHYEFRSDSVDEFAKRVEFYAKCTVFDELANGRTPGHGIYLSRANAALLRLFPIGK